jgi:adenosylcobinamide-phosphate synthase
MDDVLNLFQNTFVLMFCCVCIDTVLGDPVYRYHPIRLIGDTLSFYENKLRDYKLDGFIGGILLFILLTTTVLIIYFSILWILFLIHPLLAIIWKLFIGWNCIALKDLSIHTFRISKAAESKDIEKTRFHVSMLTGRDTSPLDFNACNRAGIESLGESFVDGVLSPLFWMCIFGIPGAIVFKIVSTMDSMVGYKNEKYFYFGKFGARLDDVLNYIPARLSMFLISLSSLFIPGASFKKALKIGYTQHSPIPGPNAGWSEATLAGALQKKLVGPIYRDGICVTTVWIGDEHDPECGTRNDVIKANKIIFGATFLSLLMALSIQAIHPVYLPMFWWQIS